MLKLGKYRHYKQKEYEVIGVAKHSETMEELVVYRKLYDDCGLWVRPLTMFIENVEVDGEMIPRFKYIDETEGENVIPQVQNLGLVKNSKIH